MDNDAITISTASSKKRIPVSFEASDRASNVDSDYRKLAEVVDSPRSAVMEGGHVLGEDRCCNLKKVCEFVEKPLDPYEQKIENLEQEVNLLKQSLEAQQRQLSAATTTQNARPVDLTPSEYLDQAQGLTHASPETPSSSEILRRKRNRSQFELEANVVPNFATQGLISSEQAKLFFDAFFQGCDRYVPIFDPSHDTFESISSRSALLFDAIVTIGCGVLSDADSQISNLLNFHLKKILSLVIVNPEHACLETVQALLVIACYVSERSLLLAFATRMGLELGLPDAYEDLRRSIVSRGPSTGNNDPQALNEADAVLMRRSRVWFELMILESILHVDAGNLRGFQLRGDPRRCRILLNRPQTSVLDLRLLSQVELNALRGQVHDRMSSTEGLDEEDVMNILHDVQVDIDVWYEDWRTIMQSSPTTETPVLLINLEVQKCWSQTVAFCRAIRALGGDNVAAMSSTQRDMLQKAKDALQTHLRVIIHSPQHYLAKFCYAMDFVWAKCAFCFLLLLKLTRLPPETDDVAQRRLLDDGKRLLKELNKAGGGWNSGGRSATSRIYLQVLHQSIQKYRRVVESDDSAPGQDETDQAHPDLEMQSPLNYFWTAGGSTAANEIDSFIPEQFVTEWDFPGLELSLTGPVVGNGFFDEFLVGNLFNDTLFPGMLA